MNVYLVGPNSFFHSAKTLDPTFGRGPVLAVGGQLCTCQSQPLYSGVCVLEGHKDVKKCKT